jgi:hypothetical protein
VGTKLALIAAVVFACATGIGAYTYLDAKTARHAPVAGALDLANTPR